MFKFGILEYFKYAILAAYYIRLNINMVSIYFFTNKEALG